MKRNKKKIILYMRLSLADSTTKASAMNESDSIEHQREILTTFLALNRLDSYSEVLELIDDGYTGTDFERPKFQEMMEMVYNHEVKMIVVKDLSRLGRDYLDVGYLTDVIFPAYRVRLIAVNDHYDSQKNEESTADIDVALKNIANQFYSVDLSKKMKSARAVWLLQGKHMGAIPFGYKKGDYSGHLVIDPEAAEIVRLVFQLASEGQGYISCTQVAKRLNEMKIMTPSVYLSKRLKPTHLRKIWTNDSVSNILKKYIYTGNLVKYMSHNRRVGSHSRVSVPRSEWEIVPNTHEAIISQELFDEVQERLKRKQNGAQNPKSQSRTTVLKGLLRCKYCGAALLVRKQNPLTYMCESAFFLPDDSKCSQVVCYPEEIEDVVITTLNKMAAASSEKILSVRDDTALIRKRYEELEKQRVRAVSDLSKQRKKHQKLFEQLVDGQVSQEDFVTLKAEMKSKLDDLENQIEMLAAEQTLLQQQLSEKREEMHELEEYQPITKLSKEDAVRFIKHIIIAPGKAPEITFNFKNIFPIL